VNRAALSAHVAMGILAAAAVVAPLCLGASGAWPRLALETAMAVSAVTWAVRSAGPTRALVIPVAIAALLLLQIVPLSDRMLIRLAPVSGGAWKIASQGSPGLLGTVAIDPAAAAAAIRRLLLGMATIAAVTDLARSPMRRRWLVGAVAASGLLIWTLGLVFRTTPEERIILSFVDLKGPIDYWLTPLEPPVRTCGVGERAELSLGDWSYTLLDSRAGDGFGPYIYSNHFAGALCLTVPAIMGCTLAFFRGLIPDWARFVAAAGIGIAGVATSAFAVHSRAGAASLLAGVLVFFSLAAPFSWLRRAISGVTLAFLAVLVAFMLLFFGPLRGWEKLLPAAAQPAVAAILADPRVMETDVALRMFRASPLLGTGLDSYGELNAVLHPGRFVSYYAHNDYAQVLAETGLLGAGLLAAGALLFGRRFRQFLATPEPADRDLSYASWAAVVAIAVHSAFDWNLRLPANALLACLVGGTALASGSLVPAIAPLPRSGSRLAASAVFAAACMVALGFLARDAASEQVQRQLRTAVAADRLRIKEHSREPPAAELKAALAAGERMAAWDSSNPKLAILLAQAHLHLAALPGAKSMATGGAEPIHVWSARARSSSAFGVGLPVIRNGVHQ
jgi:O-antigen ligase